MWKRFDKFRNSIILWTERTGFFFALLIMISIPGIGMLIDHYTGIKVLGPVAIGFYATLGVLAQVRDLQLLRERHKRDQYEWQIKNLPPYDGF